MNPVDIKMYSGPKYVIREGTMSHTPLMKNEYGASTRDHLEFITQPAHQNIIQFLTPYQYDKFYCFCQEKL